MLLADVARASLEIAATSARSRKAELLAGVFRAMSPAEAPLVVSYLSGRLPQRRLGVGWAAFREPPPRRPRPGSRSRSCTRPSSGSPRSRAPARRANGAAW